MKIWLPQYSDVITNTEIWEPLLDWRTENLRLFEFFKLTGYKTVDKYRYKYDQNIKKCKNVYDGKHLAYNPLFTDYEGEYVPVNVTFEPNTQFVITKIITVPKKGIIGLKLKIHTSQHKKLINRVFVVNKDQVIVDFDFIGNITCH